MPNDIIVNEHHAPGTSFRTATARLVHEPTGGYRVVVDDVEVGWVERGWLRLGGNGWINSANQTRHHATRVDAVKDLVRSTLWAVR